MQTNLYSVKLLDNFIEFTLEDAETPPNNSKLKFNMFVISVICVCKLFKLLLNEFVVSFIFVFNSRKLNKII